MLRILCFYHFVSFPLLFINPLLPTVYLCISFVSLHIILWISWETFSFFLPWLIITSSWAHEPFGFFLFESCLRTPCVCHLLLLGVVFCQLMLLLLTKMPEYREKADLCFLLYAFTQLDGFVIWLTCEAKTCSLVKSIWFFKLFHCCHNIIINSIHSRYNIFCHYTWLWIVYAQRNFRFVE